MIEWDVLMFTFVVTWSVWNKIAGSEPGIKLSTTIGCLLSSQEITWYGISEGCNDWENTWD